MAVQYNQNQENYFSRLLRQKGPTYITDGNLTEREVARSVETIINDIINGRIDYDKYGQYVLNPVVFDTVLGHCRDQKSMNLCALFSMDYVLHQVGCGNIKLVGPLVGVAQPGFMTEDFYNNILYNRNKINYMYTKYSIMTEVLESVQTSHNVYELVYATSKLKLYAKSNKW